MGKKIIKVERNSNGSRFFWQMCKLNFVNLLRKKPNIDIIFCEYSDPYIVSVESAKIFAAYLEKKKRKKNNMKEHKRLGKWKKIGFEDSFSAFLPFSGKMGMNSTIAMEELLPRKLILGILSLGIIAMVVLARSKSFLYL